MLVAAPRTRAQIPVEHPQEMQLAPSLTHRVLNEVFERPSATADLFAEDTLRPLSNILPLLSAIPPMPFRTVLKLSAKLHVEMHRQAFDRVQVVSLNSLNDKAASASLPLMQPNEMPIVTLQLSMPMQILASLTLAVAMTLPVMEVMPLPLMEHLVRHLASGALPEALIASTLSKLTASNVFLLLTMLVDTRHPPLIKLMLEAKFNIKLPDALIAMHRPTLILPKAVAIKTMADLHFLEVILNPVPKEPVTGAIAMSLLSVIS